MFQKQRLDKILDVLSTRESLSYIEIMEMFSVSRETARRDIITLVNQGFVTRTHGGIVLNSAEKNILNYKERQLENQTQKVLLTKEAISLLNDNDIVYFDVSTTINLLCSFVNKPIEAYSNSFLNIQNFKENVNAHMLGGLYHSKNNFVYGSQTINEIHKIIFDMAFVGVASIKDDGFYFSDYEDAQVKSAVISRSKLVCAIYDDSKYYKNASFKAFNFKDVQIIITNSKPPEYIYNQMKKAKCKIIIKETQ